MKDIDCMSCDTPITVIALADGLHITWAEYNADSLIPWAELGVTAVTFKHPEQHGGETEEFYDPNRCKVCGVHCQERCECWICAGKFCDAHYDAHKEACERADRQRRLEAIPEWPLVKAELDKRGLTLGDDISIEQMEDDPWAIFRGESGDEPIDYGECPCCGTLCDASGRLCDCSRHESGDDISSEELEAWL